MEPQKWSDKISNNTSDSSRALQRIFIGYLKSNITRKDLFEIFTKYGEIVAVSINRNGYGFVQFATEESAALACDENGRTNRGCTLQVKQCSPSDVRKKVNRERSRSPVQSPRSPQSDAHSTRSRSPPNRTRSPTRRQPPPSIRSSEDLRKPNDCEVVVMSKQYREYAEVVERRFKNLGLKVDVLFLRDEALLTEALEDLGLRGTLYACVIDQQHEMHNSVTLNVLHGVPQEHRNMPVDDALKFLAKNFREHLERKRDRDVGEDEREIKFLLKIVIEGRYVSIKEYDRLIEHLSTKREQLIREEFGDSRRAFSPKRAAISYPSAFFGSSSRSNDVSEGAVGGSGEASSTDFQNEKLHDQIRKLIGAPTQGLAPVAAPVNPNPENFNSGLSPQTSKTFLNFNNPSVQEALDKLMKNFYF